MGSLFSMRGGCATTGTGSGCGIGTGSLRVVWGVGGCCTDGFSSTIFGAGVGIGAGIGAGAGAGTGEGTGEGAACASRDVLVLLLRCATVVLVSFGSAGLRVFLDFFSGSSTFGSFVLGFGPGFLRGTPEAVSLDVADAGVDVLVFTPAPTPGVLCSGGEG